MASPPSSLRALDAEDRTAMLPDAGGAAPVPDMAEIQIPGFVLVRPIGRGAYGLVWQAVRIGTGQDVALKVFTATGRLDWRYLQREVDRLLRVAEHPHIITLLDANLQHSPPYYAMALLRRGSLAGLGEGPRGFHNVEQAASWFEQITSALEFAHSKSLLHCDIKPANVLLDEEGNVRLADFGQAQERGESAFGLGTLAYMAPEQAVVDGSDEGGSAPSVAWDIYGLGATMYTLLAGKPPHSGGDFRNTLTRIDTLRERLAEYRRYVNERPVAPLRQLNPGVDPELAQIIEHCLEPDPRRRYRHITEVSADLRNRRAHRPLRCRPRTALYLLRKFVRRNVGIVSISLLAIVALYTMFATVRAGYEKNSEELKSDRRAAETQLEVSRGKNDILREDNSMLRELIEQSGLQLPNGLVAEGD